MKDDPYAKIAGLDQQLFHDQPPRAQQGGNVTPHQRDNEATLPRGNATTSEATSATTEERDNDPTIATTPAATTARSSAPSKQRGSEATRTRASAPTGHRTQPRKLARHTHDIYLDQVRWMNRLKVEFEETYGIRLTSNAIVALSVDLFRDDYEDNGDDSALMRVLVRGETSGKEGNG